MGGQSLHWCGGWRSEGARASRYSLRASACRPVALVGCSNQCCIQVGYADGGLLIRGGGQPILALPAGLHVLVVGGVAYLS